MPDVLIICPGQRDRLNLADERILERYGLRFAGGPIQPGFDPLAFIDQLASERPPVDGVFGSNDDTGHLAGILADRLGLPGPDPAAFMRCHDKLASRELQAQAVPEATPAFAGIDIDDPDPAPPLPYPFFVKPVTAHLSQLAYTVRNRSELRVAVAEARERLDAITEYDRRLEGHGFRRLVAEELLDGRLVTFEGFMQGGRMTPIGVTDAVLHPNRISFLRFDYPSTLPEPAQTAMAGIAARLMTALGFDDALFNIEFFVAPDGRITIVEVNGRMASQFAPLVQAVHGVSTYELALAIATGRTAELPPARPDMVASSFVLRTYRDAVVRSLPDPSAVSRRFGHAHVEILVRPGQRLSENDDDVASHRLAVVALAGPDRGAVLDRYAEARRLLPFDLEPLPATVR
jgi:biotin carboxylase